MIAAINLGLNDYVELKHNNYVDRIKNMYAVVDRVKIKRGYGFACPVKTLALFAHNEEFSIVTGLIPDLVKLVGEECKTR